MFGTKAKNAIVTLGPRTGDQESHPKSLTEPIPRPQPAPTRELGQAHPKSLTEPIPPPQPAPTRQLGQVPRPSTLGPARRIFKVEKPRKAYLVSAEKGPPLHVVDIRTEVRRSDDLLFHQTADASSPVILVGDLGQGKTRPYKVGLAGKTAAAAAGGASTSWLEMKRESWNMTKHTWAFPPPWQSPSAAAATAVAPPTMAPRSLSWTRTRSQAVEGYKIPRWNSRCLKLVDEGSGDVLALFTRVTASGQCGMLQVNVNWGREFDWLVFLTALLIEEKIMRQEMEAVIGDSGERR